LGERGEAMAEQRSSVLHRFAYWLFSDPDAYAVDAYGEEDPDALRQQVESAKNDWQAACSFFNNLTDPDLIDYAVYSMEAAERKYMYLLKKYKTRCGT